MKHLHLEVLFAGILLALAMPAEAHTGHGLAYDFQAGLRHPLLGIDHILAMAGVGLWAGWLGGTARGWLPSAFLASMAAGASLPSAGIALQEAEIAVAASVLAIGTILLGIPAKTVFLAENVGWVRRALPTSFRYYGVFRAPNPPVGPFLVGYDCMDAGGRATPGAIADDARKKQTTNKDRSDARRNLPYVSARHGWASVLAALFALSHGYVHALEAGTDSQALGYAGGFLVSTALLLGIGLVIGRVSRERGYWIKLVFGAICAGAGITLLLGA
jgi:hydrogenase/urease accessory protein HupE